MPMLEIAEPVGDLWGLNPAEHMLVWALRKMVAGRGDCPMIEHEFATQCGSAAEEVLYTFGAFLSTVGHASRRRLQIGFPGCLVLTGDERQLLALVAAGQAGDRVLLQSHLRWLVRAEHRATVTMAADTLGRMLARHDLVLSDAWGVQSMPEARDHALRAIA